MSTPGTDHAESLNLAAYVTIARRRLSTIAAITAIVSIAGLVAVSYRAPQPIGYRATTVVSAPRLTSSSDGQLSEQETQLFTTDRIVSLASDSIGTEVNRDILDRKLKIEIVENTQYLRVLFTDADRDLAERVALGFSEAFLAARVAELETTRQTAIDRTMVEINSVTEQLAQQTEAMAAGSSGSPERETATALASVYESQLSRLRTEVSLSSIEVVQPGEIVRATEVEELANQGVPPLALTTAVLAFGLLIGTVIGFAIDRLDPRVRGPSDAAAIPGLTVLADVPYTDRVHTESSMPVEFYRAATALRAAAVRGGQRSVVLAPVLPIRDASQAIENIALSYGESDRDTLLITLGRADHDNELDRGRIRQLHLPAATADDISQLSHRVQRAGAEGRGLVIVRTPHPLDNPSSFEVAHVVGGIVFVARTSGTLRTELEAAAAMAANSGIDQCWIVIERKRRLRNRLGRGRRRSPSKRVVDQVVIDEDVVAQHRQVVDSQSGAPV